MAIEPIDPLIAGLRAVPRRTGIITDFDGTISPIVDDPAAARPYDDAASVLAALARVYRRVAVISGRPASFLASLLPRTLTISGLYGLETVTRGRRRDHPLAGSWREVVDDVASHSIAHGPKGMLVEPKGLSLTLHFRTDPEIEPEVRRWAERQAARSGLVCRPARMSFELHPPINADKGTAMLELAHDLDAVCYLGDDVGDLQAFAALDDLAKRGQRRYVWRSTAAARRPPSCWSGPTSWSGARRARSPSSAPCSSSVHQGELVGEPVGRCPRPGLDPQ